MIIKLDKLTVKYGNFTALADFDLAFEGGAMGLLGPNGAGKSTLLRTILGLVRPHSGSGRVLDQDIATQGLLIRRGIGYMPERDCFVPSMSAVRSLQYLAELSGLPTTEARRRAHEVCHFAGLGEERYRPISGYSTGMRQKAKFAQAIVHSPQLIFFDEPTNGLDPQGHRQMLELINHISKERGIHIIVSTHLLPDVETTCDQVTVIEAGRMRRQGPIEELRGKAQGSYMVRLGGEISGFPDKAKAHGLEISEKKVGHYSITNPKGLETRPIFQAAADSGSIIHEIKEERRSLQEVFMESLEGQEKS